MRAFEYANPTTLKDALSLLGSSWSDANVLAGGTDLISLMKDGIHAPKRVVNIKNIKELGGIKKAGGNIRIGATTTLDEIAESGLIRAEFPSLSSAARAVGSPQVKNMGTIGGDICQRPRCWYFRNGYGLLPMKEGKDLVKEGQNEHHAIFGNSTAKFVTASSFGPALVALGAKIEIASPSGNRSVEAGKFFVAPASGDQREIDLKPNEIVTAIVIPAAKTRNATYEVRLKDGLDWPYATASVSLKMKGSTVESATVVLGAVAPTPWLAQGAGSALSGKSITEDVAAQAGEAAAQGATPLSGNAYKVQLVKTAVKRALLEAAKKA
jgi:xanthine dehydrogenase YagS FAD-binding subunit